MADREITVTIDFPKMPREELVAELKKHWRVVHEGPDGTWMVEHVDSDGSAQGVYPLSWPTQAEADAWIDQSVRAHLDEVEKRPGGPFAGLVDLAVKR